MTDEKWDTKHNIPAWLCVLLMLFGYFALTLCYASVLRFAFYNVFSVGITKGSPWDYALFEVSSLLAVLTTAGFLLWLEGRSFSSLGLSFRGHFGEFVEGACMAFVLYIIGFCVSLWRGWVVVDGISGFTGMLACSFILFFIVALTEELLMRGYVLGRLLQTRLNKYVSLSISSLLFSGFHLFTPHLSFLSLLNLFLAGVLLGTAYLYTRNLWCAIGLHLFWNWLQGPVLGYRVSGIDLFSPFLQTSIYGNHLITGGAFGFEGSMVCTVLLVVAILWGIWRMEKQTAIREVRNL